MTTLIQPAHVQTESGQIRGRASKDDVIVAIRDEVNCSLARATRFINWFENFVAWSRKHGYAAHYLTTGELRCHHRILNVIAPDSAVAQPGTAHALLQEYLLDPARGELGLLHDSAEVGTLYYCTVQVRMSIYG